MRLMADNPDIQPALNALAARRDTYRLVQQYYDGEHRLVFASEKFRNTFGSMLKAFADNLCPSVCDAVADRLEVTGFAAEQGDEALIADAWAIWQAQRMDRRSGEVHLEALLCGDAYVIIWPDVDGNPVLYPNDADCATVTYDPERPGQIVRAAKAWITPDSYARLTLYYPDRIEKYRSRRTAKGAIPARAREFEPFEVDGEAWPLPNPYERVPVFHFANNARIGRFGRSELADVIPLQDALNKSVADMLVAGEFVALPQRWATGIEIDVDPATGKPLENAWRPGVDRIWTVGSELAKFGEFAAADLSKFLQVQDSFRLEIARVSRTPLHYFQWQAGGRGPASGEALRYAEAPFLGKVADRQLAYGNGWEDVMRFALRVMGKPVDDLRLSALWRDPAPRGEKEHAETLTLKKALGVSETQILREAGYSDDQIDAMQNDAVDAIRRDQLLAKRDVTPPTAQ
jgi:hypothetical protein